MRGVEPYLSNSGALSVAVDAEGNVFSACRFYGTVDFDPGTATCDMTSEGYDDVFVAKLDSAGNFVWA